MPGADDILSFWFETLTSQQRFMAREDVDSAITARFHDLWCCAAGGGKSDWEQEGLSSLALVIVLDQFPRNMFRGSAQSFHSDALSLRIAGQMIAAGFDLQLDEEQRLFVYMPFMHSERLADQDQAVGYIEERMKETGALNLIHARAHRRIIRKFQRFPYRNDALARPSTPDEEKWLENVGYASLVRTLQAEG
ncbi:MAG: DUF924 domain-containing protein [Rhodobacteraceae bacterium]|nr:DUF924 domain-containing protein [Paracoccaceae bacterium]MCY4197492.1 DUF924 domain-containing protein [Paracoccaceae bacterium]MCY4326976.1 DUF924 domain-containing protein [Paracoccaceae bacterium]